MIVDQSKLGTGLKNRTDLFSLAKHNHTMEAKDDNKVVVLNWTSMEELAQSLIKLHPEHFTHGKVNWE